MIGALGDLAAGRAAPLDLQALVWVVEPEKKQAGTLDRFPESVLVRLVARRCHQ